MITNEYINRAINYILININENITVDDIARHCNFSRYYFSRLFKIETGESVYGFIKRMKMEHSAFRLKVERGRSVTDISCDFGYSSSNYSSAFKQHHKLSPVEFRRSIIQKSLLNPIFDDTRTQLEPYEECNRKISIEMLADHEVIYERFKGNYRELSGHWDAFLRKYKAYMTSETQLLERSYDDPTITNIEECLCDICITAPKGCGLENIYTIEGGKFAVYHYNGPVKHIFGIYQNIFQVWLPKSDYNIDDRYGYERYKKINCDDMCMEMDFCIPVK